jgi:hypothetical protein
MARPAAQLTEAVNSDSFLDIVASVVSIMIIMVVMEGMRIKNAPVTAAIENSPVTAELRNDLAGEQSAREDLLKTGEEVRQLKGWAAARGAQRDMLATAVAAMEKEIDGRREKMDREKRQGFDRARAVAQAKYRLEQLDKERELAEISEAAPVVLESYATPIGKVVDKNEVHFILWDEKIAYIPKDDLERAFVEDAQQKIRKLSPNSPDMTETLGPVEGFKIRYTLGLQNVGGRTEIMYLWELRPTPGVVGESAEQALSQGSQFRAHLAKLRRGMHTVTIHVYSDSFEAFRKIRKELYHQGFSVAARPLSPEMSIGFSPAGSKSTAQ